MSLKRLVQTFDEWRPGGQPMALATVIATAGSTYSKAGHRILIDSQANYQGLVSGGCLEGDLAEHATAVMESNRSRVVIYDMRGEQDELFGLGVGCEGMLEILLQPLRPDEGYAPFPALAEILLGDSPALAIVVVSADDRGPAPGATAVMGASGDTWHGIEGQWTAACSEAAREVVESTVLLDIESGGCAARVLLDPILPLPRLLLLGAGEDAIPVVRMANELGWRIEIADHRPGYLARREFSVADRCVEVMPGSMTDSVNPSAADAIVVMSHHLATDRAYLSELADCNCAYIGILGPAARRARLLQDLGERAVELSERLYGPVGLDIGADSPESIALSILAQVHDELHRSGRVGRRPAQHDD